MRVKEIQYSRGETRQIKQFEPTKLMISATAEVAEGEDLTKAYEELRKIVDNEIALQLTMLDEKIGSKIVREAAKIVGKKEVNKSDLPF